MESQRAAFEAMIIGKAAAEPAFREELLRDPLPAIERLLGEPVPPGVTVDVAEETSSRLILVLPWQPPTGELQEADLDQVSGGFVITQSGSFARSAWNSLFF